MARIQTHPSAGCVTVAALRHGLSRRSPAWVIIAAWPREFADTLNGDLRTGDRLPDGRKDFEHVRREIGKIGMCDLSNGPN